jgi:hypothetical protein
VDEVEEEVEAPEVEVTDAVVEEVVEVEVVDDVEVELVDVEVEVVDVVELDVVELDVELDVVELDVVELVVVELVVVELVVVELVVVELLVVELVDVEVEVVDVVEVVVVVEVDVVELDVVDVVVVEVVVVVVGGASLPPWTSPTLISSATNVPKMLASKRFSVAPFCTAQSWATTVDLTSATRVGGTSKLHGVLASVPGNWVPPAMLRVSVRPPLSSTWRFFGSPSTLICVLGRMLKELATSSVLCASTVTWLPLLVATLQKT